MQHIVLRASLTRSYLAQALAVARARIARDEHIENVEGHDVQREETNTRSLVHLVHRNNLELQQEQPQLQVPPPLLPLPPSLPRSHFFAQRASVELRSERRRFDSAERKASQTAALESKDMKKFR